MPPQEPAGAADRNTRLYLLVFICEAISITALWALARIYA